MQNFRQRDTDCKIIFVRKICRNTFKIFFVKNFLQKIFPKNKMKYIAKFRKIFQIESPAFLTSLSLLVSIGRSV